MSPVGGETVQHTHVPGIKRKAVGTKGARESIAPLDLGRNRRKTCSIGRPSMFSDIPDLFPFYSQNKNAMCSLFLEKSL